MMNNQCLYASCINGCIGHAVSLTTSQPSFNHDVSYHGTHHYGELLQHIVDRATATPKKPRVLTHYVNPYKDLRKASRTNFRFKGMASRSFM